MNLKVLDGGTIEYGTAWRIQQELVERREKGEIEDTLLLLEHPHVITLGRRTSPENLKGQPIPVFQVERGGDATYHGPGQLVGYPILKLEDHDVRAYLRRLEALLVRAARRFGVDAQTKEGHTGVWAGDRKVASIGVAVKDWVSYHGFALNVDPDLKYFALIRPCGLNPEALTSMKRLTGTAPPMKEVKRAVVEEFIAEFGYGEAIWESDLEIELPGQSGIHQKND